MIKKDIAEKRSNFGRQGFLNPKFATNFGLKKRMILGTCSPHEVTTAFCSCPTSKNQIQTQAHCREEKKLRMAGSELFKLIIRLGEGAGFFQ